MATKINVDVPGLGDARQFAYLQCVTAGDFAFVAGQTGVDENYDIVSPDFGPQARQAIHNVRLALEAAGTSLANIVTMTVHLRDIRDAHEFLDICHELMGEDLAPAAVLGGAEFVLPGLLIEVQATAAIDRP
jgi:enamine deaminase RidA (YjgF/YER057c/UK114 family)